jgi:hypothetical protein
MGKEPILVFQKIKHIRQPLMHKIFDSIAFLAPLDIARNQQLQSTMNKQASEPYQQQHTRHKGPDAMIAQHRMIFQTNGRTGSKYRNQNQKNSIRKNEAEVPREHLTRKINRHPLIQTHQHQDPA